MLNEYAMEHPNNWYESTIDSVTYYPVHPYQSARRYNNNPNFSDTCIVFPQWHIGSNFAFIVSFLIIVGLGIVYEWLRNFQRRIDISITKSLYEPVGRIPVSDASPSAAGRSETESLLTGHPKGRKMYVQTEHFN